MYMRSQKRPGIFSSIVASLGLAVIAGCAKQPDAAAMQAAAGQAWTKLVDEWIGSDLKAEPLAAANWGRHEYDGQFPDWSDAGLAAEAQRLKDWRSRAEAVDPATLPEAARFEREYFLSVLDRRLFWQETADFPHRNPDWYDLDPSIYLDRPYADLATRLKAYTRWASNVPTAAAQIKANLKAPLAKVYIDLGMHTFGPLADFLKTAVPQAFAGVGDAVAQAEFAKQNAAAAAALMELQAHLQQLRATQTEDFALGRELFARMLYATARVDTPLEELQKIGAANLQRDQAALAQACAEYAPGKTIRQCVTKANNSKPAGGDFVGYAGQLLGKLRQFILDKGVVTIPSEDEAKVKQSPPYNAQNSAYIIIPGPYETNMPAFYYASPPDPSWPKAKQLAFIPSKAILLFDSVHEVWPGHFLQDLHQRTAQSMFRKLYWDRTFAEGWAHYSEEMMWEEGLGDGDPEAHIGQLIDALLRDVRMQSAIGLHTKGMTLAESRKLFLEEAFQDEGNAEQQAARGAYEPGYLNYTVGKLMIRRLRADWCGKRGGADDKACWHAFHDAFLSYGAPPIPLLRGAMLGEPAHSAF